MCSRDQWSILEGRNTTLTGCLHLLLADEKERHRNKLEVLETSDPYTSIPAVKGCRSPPKLEFSDVENPSPQDEGAQLQIPPIRVGEQWNAVPCWSLGILVLLCSGRKMLQFQWGQHRSSSCSFHCPEIVWTDLWSDNGNAKHSEHELTEQPAVA